ncbi:hypothetical protein [Pragia fontium]|uniref:Uncharacterized protein n=2 Tax=Pragia fontium TaxID=82985 RepID=A0AAJ4W7I2_9GAMM|nr:hypothetical protein [Pragia fontium]AKJ41450.1 hypothetical protein QQ39_04620 [Pragia fontium]SFB98594.1 hypothetical protein SAMN02745723_10197 [Pragia fontium DSM 5563 = ATCC 49100]SUB81713.1 Uncharacterised protein [Pragia fontium]VEJ54246.1 Uncharacterised protein [Pragia fontium]GKX63013.1 hypothetical protein SOASR032_15820 [Pragia fontium]
MKHKKRSNTYCIIFTVISALALLLVNHIVSYDFHPDIYPHVTDNSMTELEWDPFISSLKFGLKYILLALFPISIAFCTLLFIGFRDENSQG